MEYTKLVIAVDETHQDLLIAELSYLGFNGFQQLSKELITYIPREKFCVDERKHIAQILAVSPGKAYVKSEENVPEENWNKKWEKTIQAQTIGRFLVKPTWSKAKPEADKIVLKIDPKMAFGTGYHETTRLMLRSLPEIVQKDHKVLDAGTGTGILAIAAVKLDAASVFAFDIDPHSITNAHENIRLNDVQHKITISQGTVDIVAKSSAFDVILANIQKNVIMQMIPFFANSLKKGGNILLSGLLKTDEDEIRTRLSANGISYLKTYQEHEWIALWAQN